MKSLQKHCADLAILLSRIIDFEDQEFDGLYYWLRLASGIKSVKYDASLLDDGSNLYCSTARHFDYKLEELDERFVTNLTQFLYIWNTVEPTIRSIRPVRLKTNDGKINRLCKFISDSASLSRPIPRYMRIIDAIHNISESVGWCNGISELKKPYFVNQSSYGLYIAYKIRNIIAHGEDIAPKTPYSSRDYLSGASLFPIVSRIVLMSIQQTLLAYTIQERFYCDEIGWFSYGGELFDHTQALQNIHMNSYDHPLFKYF